MRDEIWAGLKNAIERGANLDKAVQSFISAGYNPVDVREAANRLSEGATNIVNAQQPSVQQPVKAGQPQRKDVKNINNLPSVEISQDDIDQQSQSNVFTGTPNKVLYVPGAQNTAIQQPSQVMQNVRQPQKPMEYIPFGGVDSTRKKKIILLLGFLIVLVGLLILAVFYNQQIFDFLKKFYE